MVKTVLILGLFLVQSLLALGAEKTLYVYTWDAYDSQHLRQKFEKETGIKVITDVYSTNDTLIAKLKAGVRYDIVVPSSNYNHILIQGGLLRPLPESLRQIAKQMIPLAQNQEPDPQNIYTLPLFFGTTGLVVNKKLVTEKITSFQQFFSPKPNLIRQIGMLDELTSITNTASLVLGTSYCDGSPATLKTIEAMLMGQKQFVKVYGATGYTERMIANDVTVQLAWNSDAFKARSVNPDLEFIYPIEGVEAWFDSIAIPANSRSPQSAELFIQFLMRPENAAALSVFTGGISSLKGVHKLLPKHMQQAPELNIPKGTKLAISKGCSSGVVRSYSKIWSHLMQ